tara:strand:- start:7437 stop:8768 length:1332 start_codon:yes stop_codon:yes gene_type:complete
VIFCPFKSNINDKRIKQIICLIFAIIMSIEYFIAKKIYSAKEKNNSYTKPILRIAIFAISLSVSIMLISLMIIGGFKKNITSKVVGFGSHIVISKMSHKSIFEKDPILVNDVYLNDLKKDPLIKHINIFAEKPAVIKTLNEIHPIILKGVSSDYDWTFFKKHLLKGDISLINSNNISNNILISKNISNILNKDINDTLNIYFAQQPPRVKRFRVNGIYKTDMTEFDDLYVLGDIKHIQKLNNWSNLDLSSSTYYNDSVGGYEITLKDIENLDMVTEKIRLKTSSLLDVSNIKQMRGQIFQWLDLQDINVKIILFLMITVATINMITTLLIIILDKTNLIGILKAIGYKNWSIRKVFLFVSTSLILKGLFYGNIFAFSIALLQKYFSFIKLDSQTYYMSSVPIDFNIINILFLNLGTLIICYLILILPSYVITKIDPIKSIRFE